MTRWAPSEAARLFIVRSTSYGIYLHITVHGLRRISVAAATVAAATVTAAVAAATVTAAVAAASASAQNQNATESVRAAVCAMC